MALRIVAAEQDPDEARQEWLYSTDPAILGCRGQGHAFPKIKTGKLDPKRNWLEHSQHDGQWQLVQLCRDGCGTERCVTTNPGGTDIDLPARFRYRRTKPGYSPPAGVRVTRRECFSEVMRRRREDKGPAEAPPVKFRSG